jgi:uncharacterized membrane protein YvbJ
MNNLRNEAILNVYQRKPRRKKTIYEMSRKEIKLKTNLVIRNIILIIIAAFTLFGHVFTK